MWGMGGMIESMERKAKQVEARAVEFRDLGRMGYMEAYAIQEEVHGAVLRGEAPSTVLMVEHDPVVTLSKRKGVEGNLVVGREGLEARGIKVCQTNRGGDVTYHGPGQLVVYPIVRLEDYGLNVRAYVRMLEDVVIETLGEFGVEGCRDDCGVGVWVDGAKVGAIGVRVRRWVTMHGLALNVTSDLDHFGLIVPCGLNRPVTSLEKLLGEDCPSMERVKEVMEGVLRGKLR